MKKYIIKFIIIGTIMTLLSSCNDKQQKQACQIIVYNEAASTKAYFINYNGMDSIETICGALSFDITRRLQHNQKINMKEVKFRNIYLKDAHKINSNQQDTLQKTIAKLLLHPTKDTIPILARDATYLYMALENQHANLPRGCIEDKRLIKLSETLIEYSPIYVNTYSWFWMGPKIEEQIIQEYKQ